MLGRMIEMKKNRPYKYNSKSRLTPNSQSFPFKVNSVKKDVVTNLENTLTKLRIIEDPSEKKGSLDDGFLEGRVEKKAEKKQKQKEKNSLARKEKIISIVSMLRKFVLSVSAVGAILFVVMIGFHFVSKQLSVYHSTKNRVVMKDKKVSPSVDDSYVFVGDFHTNQFSFDHFGWDYHYVKTGSSHLTTTDLLNNMKTMIYDYNPSVVFIEVGLIDLEQSVSEEQYIDNYGKILDLISMNRPRANIVVESIYPINSQLNDDYFDRNISNEEIERYNRLLKILTTEKKVHYLDVFSPLTQNGELNSQYTDDGVSLNDRGYQVVQKEIKSVVG